MGSPKFCFQKTADTGMQKERHGELIGSCVETGKMQMRKCSMNYGHL